MSNNKLLTQLENITSAIIQVQGRNYSIHRGLKDFISQQRISLGLAFITLKTIFPPMEITYFPKISLQERELFWWAEEAALLKRYQGGFKVNMLLFSPRTRDLSSPFWFWPLRWNSVKKNVIHKRNGEDPCRKMIIIFSLTLLCCYLNRKADWIT